MTLQEIVAKYNNQYWKVLPNSLSPQCFDLAVGWTDNLGIPHYPNNPSPFPYTNASQIYTDFGSWQIQYFDRITNSPTGIPPAGSLVIWSNSYGGVGHVAIATGQGDTNTFQAFSQNDPLGSKCILKTYNYNFVLGWLVPKVQSQQQSDDCPAKLITITAERDKLNGVITGKDQTITNLNTTISQKDSQIAQLQASSSSDNATLLTCQSNLAVAQGEANKVADLTKKINDMTQAKLLSDKQITGLKGDLATLQHKYDTIKKPIGKLIILLAEKMGVQI